MSRSTHRQSKHLEECPAYLEHQAQNRATLQPRQRRIDVPRLDPVARRELQIKGAMAVYMGGRLFTLFDCGWMKDYILTANPANMPPTRRALNGELLIACYEKTVKKIIPCIAAERYLNFTTDEISNIRKERVQNLCVVIEDQGAYYLFSDTINNSNESMNGRWTAYWTTKKLDKVVGADGWHRINSVGTDTCNTMRDSWNRMARDPRARHVFFIPCDSHGLQLLMKDIIETTWFSDRFRSAQNDVTHFNKSPKQLTLLREKMCNAYNGKKRAFILSVLTRWGTQVNMIESVSRNRQALQDLCEDNPCELSSTMKELLWNPSFWKEINLINNILKPIHDIQYSSEKDGYKLHHVVRGWKQIRTHLNIWSIDTDQDVEVQLMDERVFIPRYRKQVMDIHVVAYLLHPPNYLVTNSCLTLESHFPRVLIRFFRQYEVDHLMGLSQFFAFRAQKGDFSQDSPCWACISEPVLFWQVSLCILSYY